MPEPSVPGMTMFKYTKDVFYYGPTGSPCTQEDSGYKIKGDTSCEVGSEFDTLLKNSWDRSMNDGVFWYGLAGVQRKHLEGKIGFIAQLNTKRFENRRKPEGSSKVKEPFSKSKFNFTKIKDSEVLFELKRTDSKKQASKTLVVINVSPIEYGHVLLLPNVDACIPQILEIDGITSALEMCLLSKNRTLRIGFNSLCAFASVNHLHFHGFYVDFELPIDRVHVTSIGNGLFELKDYFVRGFALQLKNRDIEELSRKICEIAWYFYEHNIPHNLLISRSNFFSCTGTSCCSEEDTVRVFIFPKLPAEAISDKPFNGATLEIGGFLPIRDSTEYENMTEYKAVEILNQYTLKEDEFEDLKWNLMLLLARADKI